MAANKKRIKDLNEQLDTLKLDKTPQDSNYSERATIYLELAQLQKKDQFIHQAIAAFTKAIELSTESPDCLYFLQRAKAYNMVGQTQKAVEDFRLAHKYSADIPDNDTIRKTVALGFMEDIAKLDKVKESIQRLKNSKDSSLTPEFIGMFEDLTNVTQRLVATVGAHGIRLDEHDQTLTWLKNRVLELQSKQKESQADRDKEKSELVKIQKLSEEFLQKVKFLDKDAVKAAYEDFQKRLTAVQKENKQMKKQIAEVKKMVNEFICHTKEEFKKWQEQYKQTSKAVEIAGGKIKALQVSVQNVNQKLFYIDQILTESLVKSKAEVQKQFSALKKQDKFLYEYAINFYWQLSNYLISYRVVSTGMVQGEQPNKTTVQSYWKTCLEAIKSVVEIIPVIGDAADLIFDAVETLFQTYYKIKFQMTVSSINSKIRYYQTEEHLSLAIRQGVLELCKMDYKKKQIKDFINKKNAPKTQNKSNIQAVKEAFVEAQQKFQEQIHTIVSKISKLRPIEQSQVYQLAVKDVVALIGYILYEENQKQKKQTQAKENNNGDRNNKTPAKTEPTPKEPIKDDNPIRTAIIEGFSGGEKGPIGKIMLERSQIQLNDSCCQLI